MLAATLDALRRTAGIAETYVITPDDDVRAMALAAGARPLRQGAGGLNEGIRAARDEAIAASPGEGMAVWRERLFAVMHRNATGAAGFFNLPPERTIELGRQVDI